MTQVRRIALSFPEASEQDHHGKPSFRVRGKIFATVPDDEHLRVMLDPDYARAVVPSHPAFAELWWGKKLAGVEVTLASADRAAITELLEQGWRRRARRALIEAYDG